LGKEIGPGYRREMKTVELVTGKQAEQWANKNRKQIRKSIKRKMTIYPLDANRSFEQFVEELKANDYKIVRNINETNKPEQYLLDLLKSFMIRRAYFLNDKDNFIPKVVIHLLKAYKFPLSFHQGIVDYVKTKLEEGDLRRLKQFRETSKFSTFLFGVVRNLIIDYMRKIKNIHFPNEITVPPEILEKLHRTGVTPEEFAIAAEEEDIKGKITGLLALKVEKLPVKEKIAFRSYYYENITNISRIARDLGITRHKADVMIKQTWNELVVEIKKEIKDFLKSRCNPSNID
jgi:RNA polymerase sigma factor (sigma-70 family)